MRALDLFSGIGGFSVGLENAGLKTVAFCEIDPFCRKILKKHWPNVPIYTDIKKLDYKKLKGDKIGKIDVICGGFPCQDASAANPQGQGIHGERTGLWKEYKRLISEIQPCFVLIENVANLRRRGLGLVLRDLWSLGYDAEWHIVPATAVGAVHERKRIWIIAYHSGYRIYGCLSQPFSRQPSFSWLKDVGGIKDLRERAALYSPLLCRANDGIPDWMDRLKSLGNAVIPSIPELLGNYIMEIKRINQRIY